MNDIRQQLLQMRAEMREIQDYSDLVVRRIDILLDDLFDRIMEENSKERE